MFIQKIIIVFFIIVMILYGCKQEISSLKELVVNIPKPDSNTIVYQSDKELGWHISIYFGENNQSYSTSGGFFDIAPNLSPDKNFIVFCRGIEPNINLQIWKMQYNGNDKIPLSPENITCEYPRFSPDGNKIAFTINSEEKTDIYVMDNSGTNWQQITNKITVPFYGTGIFAAYPSWSPNGLKIMFAYFRKDLNIHGIGIIDLQNNNFQALSSIDSLLPYYPSWSPINDEVLFVGNVSNSGGGPKIFRMNLDESNLIKLTNSWGSFAPDWSDDGSMIAYTNVDSLNGYSSIWIMNRDGSNKRKIIEFPDANAAEPSW